jgi:hypothetical protein
MPRPRKVDRSTVADTNVTFRTSSRTRALLGALVEHANQQVALVGGTVSMGSYLTSLIEREATALGITGDAGGGKPSQKPKAKR